MLTSILKQIRNRKKSNLWLIFELLLILCLIWYMVDYFFVLSYNRHVKSYYNLDHVWKVNISYYPPGHPKFDIEEINEDVVAANYERIIQTIQNHPDVESLAITLGGAPGENSTIIHSYRTETDTTKYYNGSVVIFDPRYDFFETFSYSSDKGKKKIFTKDLDWSIPSNIAISQSLADAISPDEPILGKSLHSNPPKKIVGVIDNIKKVDSFRIERIYYMTRQWNGKNAPKAAIFIKTKPSVSNKIFQEEFTREMTNKLSIGIFYLSNIQQVNSINKNEEFRRGVTANEKVRKYLLMFFLLNMLLCVLGTFWYRINTQRAEIGIRKALGANKGKIRNSLILEGIILLTIAFIPAIIIEYQFVHGGFIGTLGVNSNYAVEGYLPDKTLLRFLITNLITWIIMAVVISIAILIPAQKAIKIEASDALRED